MKKKAVLAAVLMLIVVCTVAFVAYADPSFVLHPAGRIRVALRSYGSGTATWFATAPLVYDGSFSARLSTGGPAPAATDGGGIMIGPLGWPLVMFTDSRITFWAYHWSDAGGYDQLHQPYIDIVLDNGRVMEGVTSVPVSCTTVPCPAPLPDSFTNHPYPSNLWVQMKPYGGYYTSFPTDPVHVAAGTNLCVFGSACTMASWQHAFPTARVIQIEIIYGQWGGLAGPMTIYIDNVSILGVVVPIEPETISA
jgi:hypothetical protein